MWHRVATLAEQHRLPVTDMEAFAARPDVDRRFGIINEHGYPEVSSWHCNDFVRAFMDEYSSP